MSIAGQCTMCGLISLDLDYHTHVCARCRDDYPFDFGPGIEYQDLEDDEEG